METKHILNCNLSDPTEILNSSCTLTEAMVGEETFKWTSEEIVRLIQILVRPMLTVTGTLGNVCFWASWSSLDITNGNRSHNKPLELI